MAYDLLNLLGPGQPPLSHKFAVFYFALGVVPSVMDLRFQKISGLSFNLETETVAEGGNTLYEQRLPKQIKYDNLVLERGFTGSGALQLSFAVMMERFKFYTGTCIVTLLGESGLPVAGWKFDKVYPVRYSVSDMDATGSKVLINTMELAFTKFTQLAI